MGLSAQNAQLQHERHKLHQRTSCPGARGIFRIVEKLLVWRLVRI
jgi:hypothetical protein